MTPRTGRPPIPDPKDTTIRARMSDDDLEKLETCCKATGKTRSEIIRLGIDKVYREITKE